MKSPFFLVAILFALWPGPAQADEIWYNAEVVCQKGLDAALVRFTFTYNDDTPVYRRLPARVDHGLSATRPLRRQNCTMGNGWKIRIRSAHKQAHAYGMGGADPPAYFSLWIAGRKIVSRLEWKPGYGAYGAPWIVALAIRPDRLTYCRVEGDDAPHKGVITCRDVRLRLDRHKRDRIEYAAPGTRPAIGTMLVLPGSPAPTICRAYLRARQGKLPESYSLDSAKVFKEVDRSKNPILSVGSIEVAPGAHRTLINWAGMNHYFDGDLMFVAPPTADPWAVLKSSMMDDPDQSPVDRLPAGWSLISGGQPGLYPDVSWRYVHFDTQRIAGRLYLLAQPTNREKRPTAILVQPMARGFRSVCRFQRVEPNF